MKNWCLAKSVLTAAAISVFVHWCLPADAQSGAHNSGSKGAKQILKGAVGSTARFSGSVKCSPLGYETVSAAGRTTITRVVGGSEAWVRGLKAGDTVVDESDSGNTVSVTVERGLRRYQANLRVTGSEPQLPPAVVPTASAAVRRQLSIISDHNVALIVDKSGSMATRDCPGGISRWLWCSEQARSLSSLTAGLGGMKEGMNVVVFSDDFHVYSNVSPQQVAEIFSINFPEGMTNTGDALRSAIDAYFAKKALAPKTTHPAVLAVVTDGEPNRPDQVREVIIEATRRMTDPNELSITFLQVGTAPFGSSLLRELDDNLVNQGAEFDIVDTKTFSELESLGLTGALAEAITVLRTPSQRRVGKATLQQPFRQPYRRPANNVRTIRQSTPYYQPAVQPAVPVQQQLKGAEQERAEIERKLLEN